MSTHTKESVSLAESVSPLNQGPTVPEGEHIALGNGHSVPRHHFLSLVREAAQREGLFVQQRPYEPTVGNKKRWGFANPAPLGLSAFALTTFVLSMVNVRSRHLGVPNIVVSLAYFYGGGVQILAGMWEFACGNTFGATAFSSYGGFWLSYAAIFTDAFGIMSAYEQDPDALNSALGFFLSGWFIFTFMLALCSVRTTVQNFILFFSLDLAFLFLACGAFTGMESLNKAGGWFGLISAFSAWYNAFCGLADRHNAYFRLNAWDMPGALSRAERAEGDRRLSVVKD